MFDYNNQRWGIACKVIHAFKAKSIIENVIKGIDQIEKSASDTGFVMLNLKNIIDQDQIWPITNLEKYNKREAEPEFGTFLNVETPGKMLEAYVLTMQEMLIEEFGRQGLADLFEGKKAQPIICNIVQGSTGLVKDGSALFTFIGFTGTVRIKKVPDYVVELIDTFNDRLK